MEKGDEQKREIDYIYERLNEEGRKILLLFARKIPMQDKRTD